MIKASAIKALLTKFGGQGTLRQKSLTYDSSYGVKAVPTIVVTPLVGVQASDRQKFAVDSPFRTAEEVIYVACAVTPKAGSFVDWGSKIDDTLVGQQRWAVRYVEALKPDGSNKLMFTVALAAA